MRNVVLIGHSTGGGEVVKSAAGSAMDQVSKVITAGAVPPIMVKSESNPEGTPIEVFDGQRQDLLKDRSQFYKDLSEPFYGADREGSNVSQGAKDDFWRQGMLVNLAAAYDCIKAFSETDQTEDLMTIEAPILIAQGDDDQIVPIVAAADKSIKLVQRGTLKVFGSSPRDLSAAYQDELDKDMLDFIED